jgi:hypothetical protein
VFILLQHDGVSMLDWPLVSIVSLTSDGSFPHLAMQAKRQLDSATKLEEVAKVFSKYACLLLHWSIKHTAEDVCVMSINISTVNSTTIHEVGPKSLFLPRQ